MLVGSVDSLPQSVLDRLNLELQNRRFSDYSGLCDWFNGLLAELGYEMNISRSALGRYGKNFKDKLESFRKSTEIAREVVQALPDEENNVSEACLRLVQFHVFEVLQNADEVDPKQLSQLAQAMAQVARASISVSKFRQEVRAKLEAKLDQLKSDRPQQIDKEVIDLIKREIYGIV